jgi:hypothetical protein
MVSTTVTGRHELLCSVSGGASWDSRGRFLIVVTYKVASADQVEPSFCSINFLYILGYSFPVIHSNEWYVKANL